jgi:hypothetical protein
MIGRAVRAIDPTADHDRRLRGVDAGENVMAGVLAPDDNSGHGGLPEKFQPRCLSFFRLAQQTKQYRNWFLPRSGTLA